MSSDPFADLADSLDSVVTSLRAVMNHHRLPIPGSPALTEADGEPFAGEWGVRPSLEIFGTVYLTAWACADHLAALAAVLRANCGVAASYTIARGACEAAATACYLTDGSIDARERLRRNFNCHLAALWEQVRLLTPLTWPEAAAGVTRGRDRVAAISREGARQGFTVSKMDDRRPARLDGKLPGAIDLVDACASSARGFGATSYRLLSAVAHGQVHGLSRFLRTSLPGPDGGPAGQMNVSASDLAREQLVVPACAEAIMRGVFWFAGWDIGETERAALAMHLTWARISGVPYALGSP